jgi:hypothetical protein
VGFVVDKVALGQVFSEYFGFPFQSLFHQILHHHNHSGQVTIGHSVADVPIGPSLDSTTNCLVNLFGRMLPGVKASAIHRMGGLVGGRPNVTVEESKIGFAVRNRIPVV